MGPASHSPPTATPETRTGVDPTVRGTTPTGLQAWLVDLAEARIVTPGAVAKLALRHELTGAADLLSHLASDGRLGLTDIVAAARARAAGEHVDDDVLACLSSPGVYALALAEAGTPDGDLARAADLFALARLDAERTGGPIEHADLDLQTSVASQRVDDARRLLASGRADPWVRWAARADLEHPFGPGPSGDVARWLDIVNEPFVERELAPVAVTDPAHPFDGLTADTGRPGSVDGPLVTIIVSVFRPTESLLTAVGSLVAQTWRNLQIVIVDDASPEEFRPVLDRALALDPRIEHVRAPANGGTYRARNLGVARARGELIGFQDSDDWSHPQRIERQVAPFADATVVATMSKAVWLDQDLRITVPGSQPFARIAPSLLLRREVLDRLGPFDEMRRAADTEFIERIAAVFGRDAAVTLDDPLSFYQLTRGSLSRGDFRLGWRRDARVSYHSAFRHWHRSIAEDGAEPTIVTAEGRAFPAPPEIEGVDHPADVDLVVLADMRPRLVEYTGLPGEIAALAATGLTIGLARGEAMRHAAVARAYPHQGVQRVVADGLADWRPLSAPLRPSTLLVRDPDLLAFGRRPGTVRMRPGRILVVADRLPRPATTPRVSYDPKHVERVARGLFDAEVEWLPATPEIFDALADAGAHGLRHPPQVLEVATRAPVRPRLLDQRPVIGVSALARFGADRMDRGVLEASLPRGDAYDVRILESSDRPRRYPAPGWLGFGPSLVTPAELFEQCDFVVGLPARVHGTLLVRPIIEAMSHGCIPIAHPVHRDVLGEAALYVGDRSVAELVDEVWADPVRHDVARRAAVAFCDNERAAEVFAAAIARIIGSEPT